MTRLENDNSYYSRAIELVDESPSVDSKGFRSWASSIPTDLSVHVGDFFKGLLITRIQFFGSFLDNGLEAIISTALIIKEIATPVLIDTLTSIAFLTQLNLKKSLKKIVHLKKPLTCNVPDLNENYDSLKRRLFRTVNSAIGIAVPILAYWIDRAIEQN